jgi:hypothetical protein
MACSFASLGRYLGVLVFLYSQLIAYLRRSALNQDLKSLSSRFNDVRPRFGSRKLIGELQPLRKLARAHFYAFDPDRTAIDSAKVGGYLQPRFRQIDVPTDFVALIDRRSSRDHLASYNLEVVRSLRNAGLVMEILEFDHDPSLCHFVRTGEFVRLDIVVEKFRDSVLLIFASADQLIDPVRRELLSSVRSLRGVHRCILLTPESSGQKNTLENAIDERLGILTIRTNPEAIGDVARVLLDSGDKTQAKSRAGSFPTTSAAALINFFVERPGRWTQSIGPRRLDQRRLQEQLRLNLNPRSLGWLASTSIFPELRWPLTLWLRLESDETVQMRAALDAELLAISRLPWFRSGWMPDWARNLLVRTLTTEERSHVRSLIGRALNSGRGPTHADEDFGSALLTTSEAGTLQSRLMGSPLTM